MATSYQGITRLYLFTYAFCPIEHTCLWISQPKFVLIYTEPTASKWKPELAIEVIRPHEAQGLNVLTAERTAILQSLNPMEMLTYETPHVQVM